MPRCVIINCNSPKISSTQRQEHISYHSFPHDPIIKKKWIAATGRKDWFPTKHSTICSMHFENNSFIEGKKLRLLKKTACPSIDILKLIDNEDEAIHEVIIKPDPDALEQEDDTNCGSEDTDRNSSSMFEGKPDFNDIVPILREMSSHLQTMANKREDSFESFGKYVATTLRNMPERNSMELQLQIVNLLIADQNKYKLPTNYAGEKS